MDAKWTLAVIALLSAVWWWWRRPKNRPPGPWGLPFVGYLPFLDANAPHLTLTALARRYGPIYRLKLGAVETIVLSDAKLIRSALNMDGAEGRAPLHLTHGIMKGYGLICAEGDLWKDQRKFVHNTLRLLGGTKVSPNRHKLEELILHHANNLVLHLKAQNGVSTDPAKSLQHSLGSVISQLIFGRSFASDDKTWQWLLELQEEGTKLIGIAGAINFLPFLRYLPSSKRQLRFILDGKEKTHEFYRRVIAEQPPVGTGEPTNLIQAFLHERSKRTAAEAERYYNDAQFCHLIADVFGASLDTTLATLRWLLLYLAADGGVQTRCRAELAAGGGVPAYFRAAVAEAQRVRPAVPVGIPHGALAALRVGGFAVPRGAMLVPLQWALHADEARFPDAERFEPERFLDGAGAFRPPDGWMPFQAGRRMCVGDELARMLLHGFGASVVRNFAIECDGEVDFGGECGITLTPKAHRLRFVDLTK